MTEFMKENERADLVQETIGDTLDDAMMEDGSEAEVSFQTLFHKRLSFKFIALTYITYNDGIYASQEDAIVNQILDELGVAVGAMVPEAPNSQAGAMKIAAPEGVTASGGEHQPIAVGADPGMDELEARLNNLRK